MNGLSSCYAGQTQGRESQPRHAHAALYFLTKAVLLSFAVASMLPQQALLAREAATPTPTPTPAPVVSDIQSLTEGVVMRDGMIYPSYAVQGKVYLAGTWYDTGFSSDAEYFAAMGLNPDGTFYPPLTLELANRYIFGNEYPDYESGAAAWGYPSVAEMLADPSMGGPYENMDELYVDWLSNNWIQLSEEDMASLTLTNVSGNPAALVEALQLLAEVAPSQILTALDATDWDSSTAQSLLVAAQNITDPTISGPLLKKAFTMAVNPNGLLYDSRGDIDFSGADLTYVNVAGMDLSGLQLSAAQLNTYIPDIGGWAPMQTRSFQGTNFSGQDMTGFNPVRGITALTPASPSAVGYANYSNANFTGATNLDVNVLAKATSLDGAVLTGTGISREALSSAMANFAAAEFYNWENWTQSQRDSWVNTMLQNVTF